MEIGLFPEFNQIKNNAVWARASIDSKHKPDAFNLFSYKEHLHDIIKNPTRGLLAKKMFITEKPMCYQGCAKRNFHYIQKQPDIIELIQNIKNRINTLYPNTKHIRQYIVDNNRVVYDKIKPIKKYSLSDKIKILCKRFI